MDGSWLMAHGPRPGPWQYGCPRIWRAHPGPRRHPHRRLACATDYTHAPRPQLIHHPFTHSPTPTPTLHPSPSELSQNSPPGSLAKLSLPITTSSFPETRTEKTSAFAPSSTSSLSLSLLSPSFSPFPLSTFAPQSTSARPSPFSHLTILLPPTFFS